jgi:hypothetical protein
VDLIVGTLRTFEMRPFALRPAVLACARLGQNPMSPPNVKGWPGGEAWIDSSTLLGRKQLLERMFRGNEPPAGRDMSPYAFDAGHWAGTLAPGADIAGLVLARPAVYAAPAGVEGADLVRHLVSDPAFQLK